VGRERDPPDAGALALRSGSSRFSAIPIPTMTIVWPQTFPSTHHDFVAETREGEPVDRIKRIEDGPENGTWTWSCTGCQRGHEAKGVRLLNGMAETGDEAIKQVAPACDQARAWCARPRLPLARGDGDRVGRQHRRRQPVLLLAWAMHDRDVLNLDDQLLMKPPLTGKTPNPHCSRPRTQTGALVARPTDTPGPRRLEVSGRAG
jgi:hypothetical protein